MYMHMYICMCMGPYMYKYIHMYEYMYWSAFEIKSLVRVAIQEGYRTKPISATRSLAMRDETASTDPSDCSARPQAMH